MNLKEGLRRTGLVLGVFVTLISLATYGGGEAPSKSSIAWKYKEKMVMHVYGQQTADYRANNGSYVMEGQIWPNRDSAEIVEWNCRASATNGLAKQCADYKDEVKWLWWSWVKHILLTLLVASAASAVFALLWWSFSWVLLGFTQPKDPQPRS